MRITYPDWANPFVRRSRKSATRRRNDSSLSAEVEVFEQRVLLSATTTDAGDGGHQELVDASGNEYDALAVPDPALSPATTGNFDGTGALADLSQTFFLHSNPGADHTIYLDFDGNVTSGTSWNTSFTGGADIVTPAFDFEGGASVFTDNELTTIQYVWQRVAEDYLPFNVDVTTEDPGAADLAKSGSGDSAWGIRVVIGGNSSDWYGASAGGVAYYYSFTWNSDTPAFAFAQNLLNNEKYIGEAVSHEVGHSLGLHHDGDGSTTYYQGSGSGETGWAPIMGNSYYQNLTQFSRGEYPNANNTEDDLAIITGNNGFGYRADDYGNSSGTAGALVVSGTSATASGIIETGSDTDVFAFSTGAGTVSFTVSPVYRGPNLDVLAELYDAGGTLLASANPTDLLGASFSANVGAGVYYLHVSGVGKGDPLSGGYSDYDSLGGYRIDGTIVETTQSTPSYYSIGAQNADKAEGNSGSNGYTFVVSRTGDTSQAGSVSYSVAGSGANAASANDFSGGFASGTLSFAAGESSKTITVSVNGDMDIEADEGFVVALSNASAGGQIATGQAGGMIRNDDQPGISVSPTSGLTVDESGSTATFSVVLTHPPTADVRIAVTSLDTTEGTVSTGELVFTADNWDTPQTVTVTGVDDAVRDGNQTFTIQLGPVTSTDANYSGLDPADVTVTNRDNEGHGNKGGKGGGGGSGKTNNGKGGPKKSPAVLLSSPTIDHSDDSTAPTANAVLPVAARSVDRQDRDGTAAALQLVSAGRSVDAGEHLAGDGSLTHESRQSEHSAVDLSSSSARSVDAPAEGVADELFTEFADLVQEDLLAL